MAAVASFIAGFVSGWAARSTVDSPHGLGVKALEAVYDTKARLSRWAAVERERIADLVAEVRARYELQGAASGSLTQTDPCAGDKQR
jgi:hypothetical protein